MGYEQSVESQINQLRDVLQRYKGFAVFRELLQNADDAGATRLDFGWVRGLSGAQHELLSGGPALFIVNNGEFTARNASSIAQLGLSDKAGEHGRIGKFGLGLKSIHHFGEVYFYLSSSTFDGDRYKPNDVQNPWTARRDTAESFRPKWDGFAVSDQQLIRKKLRSLMPDSHWFCLWVPLRRKEHVGDNHSAIIAKYPGDKDSPYPDIFPPDFEIEVARILPLLGHLEEVRCWAETTDGLVQPVSGLRVDPKSQRPLINRGEGPVSRPLTGQVQLDGFHQPMPLSVSFTGFDVVLNDARFEEMRDRDDWPRPLTLPSGDTTGGRSLAQPEPAVAHAAACLISMPSEGQRGRLDIVWASYLPVQLPNIPTQSLRSPYHVTLTLHGRFFVDAGRVAIDFADEQAAETRTVRQQWNDLLRDEGTLQLVLPALGSFAESLDPDVRAAVLRDLTSAVHESTLFSSYKASICQRHQWVYLHGRTAASWSVVNADTTICEVPEPKDDEAELDIVFPSLGNICNESFCVTYVGWPALLRKDQRSDWPVSALLRLLDLDATAVFSDPKQLALFVRTVEVAGGSLSTAAVGRRLREIARQGMASRTLTAVMLQMDLMQQFLALIPPESKLKIDPAAIPLDVASRLFEPLWEKESSVLITPIGSGDANPTPEEKEGILDRLLAVASFGNEEAFFEYRVLIACQVIGLPRPGSAMPWVRFEEIPIFPVRMGNEELLKLVSRSTLSEALRTDRLFVDAFGLGGPLKKALRHVPGRDFITIVRRIADAAFSQTVVPDCNQINCLNVLKTHPPLVEDDGPRVALLQNLLVGLEPANLQSYRSSFRYLLHATPEYFASDETLFYEPESKSETRWGGLASYALQQSGGAWRVLSLELTNLLNHHQRRELAVRLLDHPQAVDLIRSVGPENLDLTELTENDVGDLIEECEQADFDVVRALPMHKTTDGRRVSIDDRCRWSADFPIDGELAENVVVLEPDSRLTVSIKQREIHPHSLDAKGVIELVLKSQRPHVRWKTVLAALNAHRTIPSHLSTALKSTRWIVTRADRPITPQQVVNFASSRSMNETIRDLLADAKVSDPEAVSILELPEPFLTHKTVAGLFPDLGDMLEKLGRVLAVNDRYRLGPLKRNEASLDGLRSIFADAPSEVLPCFPLLRGQTGVGAIRENLDSTIEGRLIPTLLGGVPAERTTAILRYLAKRHADAPRTERGVFFEWYRRYLDAAWDQIPAILPDIPLLSASEKWKSAAELTTGTNSLEPSFVLHHALVGFLADDFCRAGGSKPTSSSSEKDGKSEGEIRALDDEVEQGVESLKTHFEDWAALPSVPRELIGGLLALLGDAPSTIALARTFLGNVKADIFREELHWNCTPPFMVKGVQSGGSGMSITQAMTKRRTIVELSVGDKVRVANLLGQAIEVPVRQAFEHLLLPAEDLGGRDGLDYFRVRLRRINPVQLPERLNPVNVLRETARQLLEVIDNQRIPNFDEVWDELAKSEQLDLQMAQLHVLSGLPNTLMGLGLRRVEPLASVLRNWLGANRESVQLKANDDQRRRQAEERKRKSCDSLGQLIETSAEAQNQCLEAVREKIRMSQYTPDSIPFELFQNADDAVAQLRTLQGPSRPPDASSFRYAVDTDGRSLWFASWGRAINRHQAAGFDDSVRGFDQDLEKMLTLGWSDKGRTDCGDEPTTGKFGLGFKSVFLATDRPRVVSGRLAFEVLGGLFPAALVEGRQAMQDRLRELGPEGRDGTIIELPLNGVDPDEILGRFIELVPLLVVFGREIHSCVIRPADGPTESYRWEGSTFDAVPGAQVGDLPGPERDRILVLRGKSSATVLGLGQQGVQNLPPRLPTVWVTAPTRQVEKLGFAVNAPFDLDVGRSQLAYSSTQNDKVASIVGLEIGEILVGLFRAAVANWEAFVQTLGLHDSASHLGFWESVWERLGTPLAGHPDPLGRLLREMLWGAVDRGMRRLVSEYEALPNGLWGDDRALTRLGNLRVTVSGLLDSEDVYIAVSRWPSFHLKYPRHSLISGRVLKNLTRLAPTMVSCCTEVKLCEAIKGELGSERRAEPGAAEKLGAFISPGFITNANSRNVTASQEISTLIADLADIQFQSRSGQWHPAVRLVASVNHDECLRADFAPAECVLSDDYAGAALDFFCVCRKELSADAKRLKQWAIEAVDEVRRKGVLKYIIHGELGQALANQLLGHISGTWLARLEEREIVNTGFTHNDAAIILGRLHLCRPSSYPVSARSIDARFVLERTHEWWESKRDLELQRYVNRWYPEGRLPRLPDDITRDSRSDDRRGWMTLFMLGAMHTMGRTRAEAHRNFLEMCEKEGWLEVFSRPTDNLIEWMDVLKVYLDRNASDSPYLLWMGRFVSIFQLAHWLHEYVGAFLAIEQFKHEFELDAITAIRTSREFQGGGQDAPPVSRTLGIGACFVVRELVRTKKITNRFAHRHCYVPSSRVRRLLSLLGCPNLKGKFVSAPERVKASGIIYDYLVETLQDASKALFHGDFDLPLVALTEPANRDQLSSLLGTNQVDDLQQSDDDDQEVF
jgi:hypothetical protein